MRRQRALHPPHVPEKRTGGSEPSRAPQRRPAAGTPTCPTAPAGRSPGSFESAPRNFCKTNNGLTGPRSSQAEGRTKPPLLSQPSPPRFPPPSRSPRDLLLSHPCTSRPNRRQFKLGAHAQYGLALHPHWPPLHQSHSPPPSPVPFHQSHSPPLSSPAPSRQHFGAPPSPHAAGLVGTARGAECPYSA